MAETADRGAPKPRPQIAEAVAYLGATLTVIAAVWLGQAYWSNLSPVARAGGLGIVTGALVAGGAWTARVGSEAAARLTGVLWLLATAVWAVAAFVAVYEVLGLGDAETLAAGLAAAGLAAALRWRRRHALQQVPLFVSVLICVQGVLDLAGVGDADWFGLGAWVAGVAWLLLARSDAVPPPRTATALGCLAVLAGPELLIPRSSDGSALLGLATVAALFVVAARPPGSLAGGVAAGFGIVGAAVFVPQGLASWFPEVIGVPVAVLLSGVLLLIGALVKLRPRADR